MVIPRGRPTAERIFAVTPPQAIGEDDLHHIGHGGPTTPVALKLASQRHPADRLTARTYHALKAGPVGLDRGSADEMICGWSRMGALVM